MSVVGGDHPNARGPTRRFEIALCRPGDPIELRREPKNPADPRAVAVYSERDVQLGYITAERAPWIGSMIENGREVRVVFQAPSSFGAWIRVAFDGAEPILPPVKEAAPPPDDSGFWPDPEWPD